MERGTLIDHDGRPAVHFRREFAQPVERLWAAITNPDDLAHWFPSNVRMEPRAGGAVEFPDRRACGQGHGGAQRGRLDRVPG